MIIFPSNYYLDIYKDICLFTLDTNSDFIQQAIWYNKQKNKFKKVCKLSLAFSHHPLYSSGKHGNANLGVDLFMRATIKGSVDALFSGHDHNLELIKGEGFTQFVSGSAGAIRPLKREPSFWGVSKAGYLVLSIQYVKNLPQIEYQFKSLEPNKEKVSMELKGILKRR